MAPLALHSGPVALYVSPAECVRPEALCVGSPAVVGRPLT